MTGKKTDCCKCGSPARGGPMADGKRYCYDCVSDGEQITDEQQRQKDIALLLGVLAAVGWALFFGSVIAMGIK